jgi:hypothetical protein
MRQIISVVALLSIFLPITYASTPRRRSASIRPYYGGGKHTTSHGGGYPGATNSHHKNGHYSNWRTSNRYGVHKP